MSTTITSRSSGIETGDTVRSWQSIASAAPSTPPVDASWSMIPHGTPDARCSAAWHSRAMSSAVPSAPRARATATSSAALEDSPAPIGIVVETLPSNPVAGRSSATTPATYRAQSGSTLRGSSMSMGMTAGSAASLECSTTSFSTALAPHLGPPVDRHRHDQAARVVGVVTDEVHAPGARATITPTLIATPRPRPLGAPG